MNYDQTLEYIAELDGIPEIMDVRVGRWCAWPIVRSEIWFLLLSRLNHSDESTSSTWRPVFKLVSRIRRGLKKIAPASSGFEQALASLPMRRKPAILILRIPRYTINPDKKRRDPYYDNLLSGHGLPVSPVRIEYNTAMEIGNWLPRRDVISAALFQLLSRLFSFRLVENDEIVGAAMKLTDIISTGSDSVNAKEFHKIIRDALARFEAGRRIYKWFYRKFSLRMLLLIDADSRCAEIAAAKELHVPVIEFQHGMWGYRDVDYSWPGSYRPYRERMVIPDRAFVFGELWQKMALQRGFWDAHQIIRGGSAIMDRFREEKRNAAPHFSRGP